MEKLPWTVDRELTLEQARSAIRSCFDDIPARRLLAVGSGWDNDAYLVDDRWLFRFPRRCAVADQLDGEIRASALAAEALANFHVRTPRFTRIGYPSEAFPYRFAAYEWLAGTPAEGVLFTDSDAHRLGSAFGRVVSSLHALPVERVRQAGIEEEPIAFEARYIAARRAAEALSNEAGASFSAYRQWLRSHPPRSAAGKTPVRFLHNDLCPEHVLWEPHEGRIAALIDWGDAALGDPALDFLVLPAWLGSIGTRVALEAYALDVDTAFEARIHYLARLASVHWLYDAHRQGADVVKHRQWMRRAFAGVEHART